MKQLKILLASSEVAPFAKTGGLADVTQALPRALGSLGCKVAVFLPYYKQTSASPAGRRAKEKDFAIRLLKKDIKTRLGSLSFDFSLYHCQRERVDFFFVDKPDFFERDFLYGSPTQDYPDNAHRFAFFARAVLASASAIGFRPDIIHCNDWQTALVPFYLKYGLDNNFFKDTKTLFTIHNLAYQGLFAREIMPEIGIGYEFFTPDTLEFYSKFSFMKAGILYSNAISTVSQGYAREILTPEFGCGLEGLLGVRKHDIFGILNGVDYSDWNPKVDKFIKSKYDINTLSEKSKCKKDLFVQMKIDKAHLDAPLLGLISRLAQQKGIDIIVDAASQIVKLGANLVILGTGDEKYHQLLKNLAKKYRKNISVKIAFDNALAHKIEAGCDMLLMPSRYEPCGLNQMYSLKYGTIPVVRAVGGLDDTIIDYSQNPKFGNGFKFREADISDLLNALGRAISVYSKKREWVKLVRRAMKSDFSWKKSAREYMRLYSLIGL